ncbi:hypothetical protein LTR37_006257 [Vermiconidia calcicola]|uniref:Uncharacterized protein n=1 Tax=Vermiconidia calcicola TaxID=1690605 RepID=A0ACC3NHX4_9PEZI|nr:hypothetical protein LTR37_006257 [Vermiconidia calcicola]
MHLLRTRTYELVNVEESFRETPPYAILSHRWQGKEIVFKDLSSAPLSSFERREGSEESFTKIRGACALAQNEDPKLEYIWIDTCCIDKSSSEELRTALNSMFKWYHEAEVCYTFLFDVTYSGWNKRMFDSNLEHRKEKENPRDQASEWFERGWTLQELFAPVSMEFYDKHWKPMGTRDQLAELVGEKAGIDSRYLKDDGSQKYLFREASVAVKMSWMVGRMTRDVEDIAYSLLGIFNVNLIQQYGEGHKAFSRLQETIMADTGSFDESLFAWELPKNGELRCYLKVKPQPEGRPGKPVELIPKFEPVKDNRWGLLAPSPDCFKQSEELGDVVILQDKVRPRLGAGFQRTHQGIFVTLPYPEVRNHAFGYLKKKVRFPLNCWRLEKGRVKTIVLELERDSNDSLLRTKCDKLEGDPSAKVGNTRSKMAFGVDQGSMFTVPVTIAQPQIDLIYPAAQRALR